MSCSWPIVPADMVWDLCRGDNFQMVPSWIVTPHTVPDCCCAVFCEWSDCKECTKDVPCQSSVSSSLHVWAAVASPAQWASRVNVGCSWWRAIDFWCSRNVQQWQQQWSTSERSDMQPTPPTCCICLCCAFPFLACSFVRRPWFMNRTCNR